MKGTQYIARGESRPATPPKKELKKKVPVKVTMPPKQDLKKKKPKGKGHGMGVKKLAPPPVRSNIPLPRPAPLSRPAKVLTPGLGLQLHSEEHSRGVDHALVSSNKKIAEIGNLKNLRGESEEEHRGGMDHRVQKMLSKYLDAKQMLSPDAYRYSKLLEDPLRAPWGDEGEVKVRPLIYVDQVPPSSTDVSRNFGQTTISIPAGQVLTVALTIGPGNINSTPTGYINADSLSDDVQLASPNFFEPLALNRPSFTPSGGYGKVAILGAPKNDSPSGDVSAAALPPGATATDAQYYQGCAGYWYLSDAGDQTAPVIDTNNYGLHNGVTYSKMNTLDWGNPPTFGGMVPLDSSTFKYRPVAGGVQITPITAEFQLGGQVDIEVIPYSTNEAFTTSYNFNQVGQATYQELLAIPDHKVVRADNTIEAAWLPSRLDYSFYKMDAAVQNQVFTQVAPTVQVQGFLPANALNQNITSQNSRMFIRVTPAPGITAATDVTLSYVGFYEIAGKCIEQTGTVPRANPGLGSKIGTAIQESMLNEMPTSDRTKQITDGTVLQMAKDHPKLGPMVEDKSTLPEAKSFLSEVVDIGKDLLPALIAMI